MTNAVSRESSWDEAYLFKCASYLTEPICKCHEWVRRFSLIDVLDPTLSKIESCARKWLGVVIIASWAVLATICTFPGIVLRSVASYYQKNPFLFLKGDGEIKSLEGNQFSLLSWNVCCVPGGYPISDGGVLPWADRIGDIAQKIREEKTDVIALYEVFDLSAGFQLYEALKSDFPFFYFNIGPRAIGASSGMFVASRFEIENPTFMAFPKEMLVGRTKNSEKGVFSFDLSDHGAVFATIFSTHLQHSEECEFPTKEEVVARKQEMEMIMGKVDQIKDRCLILTGDLNLDEKEFENSAWSSTFLRERTMPTWLGDQFCAQLVGKRPSGPLLYDYALVRNGTVETQLVKTGYDPTKFKQEALSDHEGLFSRITLI